jgi:CheY-like chemotaxis protein
MDIAMPGRDGWDAARAVRQYRTGNRPMLIAVSGTYPKSAVTFAEASGFDYYLSKPFDPNVLLKLVASYTK